MVIWSGRGRMRLGKETVIVGEGSVLFIPRGTRHSFVPFGPDKAVALSIFSPAFDGKDRIFVPENK